MIEAIHLGPWLDEMAQREPHQVDRRAPMNLLDCNDCRKTRSKEKRQMHGCEFEPRVDAKPREVIRPGLVYVGAWAPSGYLEQAPRDDDGDPIHPSTCIGYTRTLPLVSQIRWDRLHWERGSLGLVYDEVTEEHWDLLKRLEGSIAAKDRWAFDNPKKPPGQP